jgi:hypothetical protein
MQDEKSAGGLLTTNEFAADIKVKPQTIRKRVSATGAYFTVKPEYLENGHMRWPYNGRDRLLKSRR